MPCLIALIVLAILSLFSAKYQQLTKSAVDCVIKRVTLKPCDTGFDIEVKSAVLSKIALKSPQLAKIINRNFEIISWVFIISLLLSLFFTLKGLYLYYAFGSCNGLNQQGFCILDPGGKNNKVSGSVTECKAGGNINKELTLSKVNLNDFYLVKGDTNKQIVFIGCYACPFSKQVYPIIKELTTKYPSSIRYIFYPIHQESEYLLPYDYCIQKLEPNKYLDWIDTLYQESIDTVASNSATLNIVSKLNINPETLNACLNHPSTPNIVKKRVYEIDKTGIFGTPTVFVNDIPIVGPKPYRIYRRLLNQTLF